MSPAIKYLEDLITKRAVKKVALAQHLGITPQGLNSIFKRGKIPEEHVWALGEFFQVSPALFSDSAARSLDNPLEQARKEAKGELSEILGELNDPEEIRKIVEMARLLARKK